MSYWDTQKQIDRNIDNLIKQIKLKKTILSKTPKGRIIENFGQTDIRKFRDKLNRIDATFSSKQRADKEIRDLDDFVMRFGGI